MIYEHGGDVIKFAGDALLVAFFVKDGGRVSVAPHVKDSGGLRVAGSGGLGSGTAVGEPVTPSVRV